MNTNTASIVLLSQTSFQILFDFWGSPYPANLLYFFVCVKCIPQFRLFLDAKRYYPHSGVIEQEMNITLKPINDSTYLYFDKVEIEVPESLKIQFQPILEGTVTTSGTFIFVDDQRIRLIHLSED